jgi:hypothetical protein
MAEKESNPKQWSDPKDFGLPFVEISPLSKSKSKAKETKVSAPAPVEELPKVPPVATVEKKKETKWKRNPKHGFGWLYLHLLEQFQ